MYSMTQVFLSAFLLQAAEAADLCLGVQTNEDGENYMTDLKGNGQWQAQVVSCDEKNQDNYVTKFDSSGNSLNPSFDYNGSQQCLMIDNTPQENDQACFPVLVTNCDACGDVKCDWGLPKGNLIQYMGNNQEYRLGYRLMGQARPAQYCPYDENPEKLTAGYSADDGTIWLAPVESDGESDGTDRIRRSLLDQREQ